MPGTRRLAAIMFTDMVGFTAAAQADEPESLTLLTEQEEILRPLFAAHQGREIKSMGDGFLVEFESALNAVRCAVEIQQRLQERNSKPGVKPLRLRIGVHLGDVEERGNDIFGDSVNIASRIEPLAEPGGVCISEAVFGQVQNKIPQQFQKLEPAFLKNVSIPLGVYRLSAPAPASPFRSPNGGPTRLAVLPFANISASPGDEYFAEGLTEELINVISQVRDLRVIARTSVSQYKSGSKPISQIGSELGVHAVLEGSVRKSENRLRISVQLIDARTEEHTWTNTYDRQLENIFAVQSDIAKRVAKRLKVKVRAKEEERLNERRVVRPESYLAYLKGRSLLHQVISESSLRAAKAEFERAIAIDPKNASAYSGLADATRNIGWYYRTDPGRGWEEETRELAARAIKLDPHLAEAHVSMALVLWDDFDYVDAEKEFKLALSRNPSYSLGHFWYGVVLEDMGRGEEALEELLLAERTDPLSSNNAFLLACLLIWLGRLDEALHAIERLHELEPSERGYHNALARYHLARSEIAHARSEFHKVERATIEPRLKAAMRGLAYAVAGENSRARRILQREASLPEFSPTAWIIGWAYAELGDLDSCFRWLERAFASHNLPMQQFRLDPRLQHVRDDSRFDALLRSMHLD